MDKNFPLVSIIIPCYNSEDFISETIISAKTQSWKNIEIIVIDDGSTDKSAQVINSFDGVVYIWQSNQGACAARNNGANISNGKYLMFLDADDIIEPDVISNLVKTKNGDFDISGCAWKKLYKEGLYWKKCDPAISLRPEHNNYLKNWIGGWYIPPCAILWKRTSFFKIGGWDESLHANQDGDIIMRSLIEGFNLEITSNGYSLYRNHGSDRRSISNNLGSVKAFQSRVKVLKKLLNLSENKNLFHIEIGQAFHKLARNNFNVDKELARYCNRMSLKLAGKKSITGSFTHIFFTNIFGLETKEKIASILEKTIYSNQTRKYSNKIKNLRN